MSSSITDLTIEDYSEKSVVVRGNTQEYKADLKARGGKWNSRLRNGGGWIYPKTKKEQIEKWMQEGKRLSQSNLSNYRFCPSDSRGSALFSTPLQETAMFKRLDQLEAKIDKIMAILQSIADTDIVVSTEEEEEEAIPRKRLLK